MVPLNTHNGNITFLHSLVTAVILLAISATILIITYPLLNTSFSHHTDTKNKPSPIDYLGNHLALALGNGRHEKQHLILQALAEQSNRAVVSSGRTAIHADNFPFLEYTIRNLHPGIDLFFNDFVIILIIDIQSKINDSGCKEIDARSC